jgi:predicted PurR-regulated permease PerM
MENRFPKSVRLAFLLVSLILLIYVMVQAKQFLYPLAFAFLLAYMLYPVVNFLEKKYVPRILSILIGLVIVIVILYGAGFFIFRRIGTLIEDMPSLKKQALDNVDVFLQSIQNTFGIKDNKLEDILRESVSGMFQTGNQEFKQMFMHTTGALIKILLLPVYVFLFLYYRTKFAYFILKMVPDGRRLVTVRILREISTVATRYMGGIFIVATCLSVMNSIGFSIIGLKYPIFMGIIAAIFSFIPYFGTLIGYTLPFAFSLLTMNSPMYAVGIVVQYFIVHLIENNLLTPNIVGDKLKINPFFIIVGLIAAAMIWGVPGMMIVVPTLAIAKIIFENIDSLHPFAYLLGPKGTKRHAISMENTRNRFNKIKKFFKRRKITLE